MVGEELEYYNQKDIWQQDIMPGQLEVIEKVQRIIQDLHIQSILDVGCGNGFFLNSLSKDIQAVGMDISAEALKYVQRDKVIGSIDAMPFSDKKFEMVVCSDVLEHLNGEMFQAALTEIQRVAGKYVVLVFPYREDLDYSRTKCQNCGCLFHINWHLRSMDILKIQQRLAAFSIKSIWHAGEEWPASLSIVDRLRQVIDNSYVTWDKAVCPHCNAAQKELKPEPSDTLNDQLKAILKPLEVDPAIVDSTFNAQNMITKNEIILLLERNSDDSGKKLYEAQPYLGFEGRCLNEKIHVVCRNNDRVLDMGDISKCKNSLVKYPKMPYIVENGIWGSVQREDNHLLRKYCSKHIVGQHAVFVFPRNACNIDRIVIRYINYSDRELSVQAYDANRKYILLGKLGKTNGWREIAIEVPTDLLCPEEGYVFSLITADNGDTECFIENIRAFSQAETEAVLFESVLDIGNPAGKILLPIDKLKNYNLQFLMDAGENLTGRIFIQVGDMRMYLDDVIMGKYKVVELYHWMLEDPCFQGQFNKQGNHSPTEALLGCLQRRVQQQEKKIYSQEIQGAWKQLWERVWKRG